MRRILTALAVIAGSMLATAPAAQAYDTGPGFFIGGVIGAGISDRAYAARQGYYGHDYPRYYGYPPGYYREGSYRRAPVYGTTYAAPSYVDEDCRILSEPTAFGWRRYRVCE